MGSKARLALFILGALLGSFNGRSAWAADGAGLFALPADTDSAPVLDAGEARSASLTAVVERVIDGVRASRGGPVSLAPMMASGGLGLRFIHAICELGCPREPARGSVASGGDLVSVVRRILGERALAPTGPPGLGATLDEARAARAKVPQAEAMGLP